MDWLVIITISLLFFSVAIIMQKWVLKTTDINPIAFAIVFQLLTGIFFLIASFIFGTFDIKGIINFLPFIILGAVLYAAANYYGIVALKQLDASKYTVIFASRGLFTVLASTIFLGDKLDSIIKIIGAILIVIGVIIVTLKKLDQSFFKFTKFEIFAVLASLTIGLANTNDTYVLRNMDIYTYTSLAFLLPSFILFGLLKEGRDNFVKAFEWNKISKVFVFSVLVFISAFNFFKALEMHNSSEVASVNLLSTVVIVVLGIVILKERDGILKKFLGSIISILGLLLITLG